MRDACDKAAAGAFDPALLRQARMPSDLRLDGGRVVFLWQPPSPATLTRLQRDCSRVPILVGRFDAEAPAAARKLTYWSAADFFPLRSLIDFELASVERRRRWEGPPAPAYRDMPLIDGNLVRFGCWSELVSCAAMLMAVRALAGPIEVITDWMGARIAKGVGLRPRRLWQADRADANWPPRRWVRERVTGERGWLRRMRSDPAFRLPSSGERRDGGETDVVILVAGWVEPRLLDAFPVEALMRRGRRCVLWVHRESAAIDELVRRTGVRCERIGFPLAAADAGSIERVVARWVSPAAQAGYFEPVRGELACRVARLMTWPRWAAKLVSMHRLLSAGLARESPQLLIAPAEKDWSAYFGHHAARGLGITSVGIKHGIWLPGSHLERFSHRQFFPAAATHVLAYTPGDASAYARVEGNTKRAVIWRGHPRVDKRCADAVGGHEEVPLRILVGARGMGPGQSMGLRRHVVPWNVRLIEALFARLGERVRVRLHPWDSSNHYPAHLRPLMLPLNGDLDAQLAEHAALVTTYSMIALDAAAAGKPVFLLDYAELDLDRSEIAVEGGAVVSPDLPTLCDAVVRFMDDAAYRQDLRARSARFPRYLRDALPGAGGGQGSMTSHLARWLCSLAGVR